MVLLMIVFQMIWAVGEAYHDFYVISGKDPDKTESSRMWHKIDGALWTFIYGSTAFTLVDDCGWWIVGVMVLTGWTIRLSVFPEVLNQLLGVHVGYLGSNGMDGWMKRNIGERVMLWLKCSGFLVVLGYGIYSAISGCCT